MYTNILVVLLSKYRSDQLRFTAPMSNKKHTGHQPIVYPKLMLYKCYGVPSTYNQSEIH